MPVGRIPPLAIQGDAALRPLQNENVRHVVVASADPGFSVVATKPTARQVATMLTFAARREPSIAAALDRMFGSEDLLEILG